MYETWTNRRRTPPPIEGGVGGSGNVIVLPKEDHVQDKVPLGGHRQGKDAHGGMTERMIEFTQGAILFISILEFGVSKDQ